MLVCKVCFAGSIWKTHTPTGQRLPLRNMTNIEPRNLFYNIGAKTVSTGRWRIGKTASCLAKPCIIAQQRRVNTGWNNNRLRDQLHLAARQQGRFRLDNLCLHGTSQLSLLVTSVSLVSSCNKKWTCPPHNHVRTFDLSGDILACLGQRVKVKRIGTISNPEKCMSIWAFGYACSVVCSASGGNVSE